LSWLPKLQTSPIRFSKKAFETLAWEDAARKPSWDSLLAEWDKYTTEQQIITQTQQAKTTARTQAIEGDLSSWDQLSTSVDKIENLADAKVFIKKLARIIYWLAKDSES